MIYEYYYCTTKKNTEDEGGPGRLNAHGER